MIYNAEMKERPDGSSQHEISRRKLLEGFGAAGLFATLRPGEVFAGGRFNNAECLAYFDSLRLDLAALRHFREHPSSEELTKVVRALSLVDKKWTADIRALPGALHAGARVMRDTTSDLFSGNGTVLRIRDPEKSAGGPPVYRYCEVTAAHVVGVGQREWIYHPTLDIAVREITKGQELENAKNDHLHYSWTGSRGQHDISFQSAVILGDDNPNETFTDLTTPLRRKCYTSLISPELSPGVFSAMKISVPKEPYYDAETMQQAVHAIVLPPGEAHKPDPKVNQVPAQGMSGSALLFMPRTGRGEGVQFGGIIVSVVEQEFADGQTYSLGFVLDHLEVRTAIQQCLNLKEAA